MKQTQLGATLVLQDVVFETARAELKPGAEQRLAPLVSYLQANPEVRVRIDGHTDSRGSTAYNQRLSEARRSEEHTSELQSLMRISYAVFCLKKKKKLTNRHPMQTCT